MHAQRSREGTLAGESQGSGTLLAGWILGYSVSKPQSSFLRDRDKDLLRNLC